MLELSIGFPRVLDKVIYMVVHSTQVISEELNGSCLYSTLYGLRSSLLRHFSKEPFSIKEIPVILTVDSKRLLRKKISTAVQSDVASHPYLFLELNTIEAIKDQNAYKTLQKTGYFQHTQATGSSLMRSFLFPAKISITLNYLDNDIERSLRFVEDILLLTHTGNMNYTIVYADGYEWVGNVTADTSVLFNKIDLESNATPSELVITYPMYIDTKIGFLKAGYRLGEQGVTVDIGRRY
jgi:hypothetical protein